MGCRRVFRARDAWLLCGAGWLALPGAGHAQEADPPRDPLSDMEELPDLGLDWPDPPGTDGDEEVQLDGEPDMAAAPVEEPIDRAYAVAIEGLPADVAEAVRDSFDARSNLEEGDGEADNAAQVDRRAQADAEVLAEILRSEGYYDAVVAARTRVPEGEGAGTIGVTLSAEPGGRYRFEEVNLPGIDAVGTEEASALRAIYGIDVGDPVRAEDVIAAKARLREALGRRGYALGDIGDQEVVIDHETQDAVLTLPVEPGVEATFGAIRVSGEPPFSDDHVRLLARFEPGDTYDSALVVDLRRALIQTGLVANVDIAEAPRDGGTVDLEVALEPAPPRTISGEAGYQTGEGARIEANWTHRNFFNPEGAITVSAVAGTQEQLGGILFRRSNWKKRDLTLTTQATAGNVDRDAYKATYAGIGAGVERLTNFLWQKPWVWSAEAEILATREEDRLSDIDFTYQRDFFIAALAGALRYDGTESLLDPTRGFRLGGRLAPELSVGLDSFEFQGQRVEAGAREEYLRAEVQGSIYVPTTDSLVMAGRLKLATIYGADRDNIAPSRRFYAGGGSSVRGYGYQMLGPKDVQGDPIGGRSLTEFSIEGRYRFGGGEGAFGVVPFIDGGRLSEGPWPGTRDWQFGVGIGARYYSSFGPIRIDVATPINRQEGDSRIAVVVSLGQAF